jgi:hypothetical protein
MSLGKIQDWTAYTTALSVPNGCGASAVTGNDRQYK